MYKFDLKDEVVFKAYDETERRGVITGRTLHGRYMQPYYRIMSGMIVYTDIMESMIEFETPRVDKPVKLSQHISMDKDGFLICGRNIISGVRSGKSETHANSLFDKESRDRIMKLMGNKEIRVMEGTENLFYKKYYEGLRNDALDAYMYGIDKMAFVGKKDTKPLALTPSKVFFNDKKKATTIMFGETATVVKCGKGDKYDRRIGFLEAYFQATCNMSKNKALKYLNEIVKDKKVKEETKVEEKPNETI